MKIGIIGAMPQEVEPIITKLRNRTETIIGKAEFHTGEIDGTEIVLVRSGVGKAHAASATTSLILKHKPDYVINIGTAGAYDKQIKIGDVVISNETMYSDVDVTAFGFKYGQVPGLSEAFAAHQLLVNLAQKSAARLNTNVFTGLIASSDNFNSNPEKVEAIKKRMKEAGKRVAASEMEAASVAQVCHEFDDVPFLAIRGITNIAGKRAADSFTNSLEAAAQRSADLTLLTVKELGQEKNAGSLREIS